MREPSARQTKYRDKRANPRGRIPGDVWTIRRVCGTFGERVRGHSCQTPLALAEKVVCAYSRSGDMILDPMTGTGSIRMAALGLGRRFVGIELCEDTAERAKRRLVCLANEVAG